MNTARFLKYVWSIYNILHERVSYQTVEAPLKLHHLWFDFPVSQSWDCLLIERAKTVPWCSFSPFRGWDSLTI